MWSFDLLLHKVKHRIWLDTSHYVISTILNKETSILFKKGIKVEISGWLVHYFFHLNSMFHFFEFIFRISKTWYNWGKCTFEFIIIGIHSVVGCKFFFFDNYSVLVVNELISKVMTKSYRGLQKCFVKYFVITDTESSSQT